MAEARPHRLTIPIGPGPMIGRAAIVERRRLPSLGHAWPRKLHRWYRDHGMLWERMFDGRISKVGATEIEVSRG